MQREEKKALLHKKTRTDKSEWMSFGLKIKNEELRNCFEFI